MLSWDLSGYVVDILLVYDLGVELVNSCCWLMWEKELEFRGVCDKSEVVCC